MTTEQLVRELADAGEPDAEIFTLALGCARHGQGDMDYDMDAHESFCHSCERESASA
jgi:hypothetical protein